MPLFCAKMAGTNTAPRDQNRIPTLLGVSSIDFGGTVTVAVNPSTHAVLIEGSISATNPSVGVDGDPAPTSSTQIGWEDGSGNLTNVSAANPLPVSGSFSLTNPTIGAAVPSTANYIAASKGGNLTGLLIGSQTTANSLAVALASDQVAIPVTLTSTTITGTVAVTQGTSPWIVAGGGTAGSAASGVVTVQGIASMTPVQVSQATASNLNATVVQGTGSNLHTVVDSGTITTVSTVTSLSQFAGNAINLGNGTVGTGTLRVTLASDSTGNIATIGTSVTPGTSAAHLGKAEDAATSSGDTGVFILATRNDTLAATTSADGDYTSPTVGSAGEVVMSRSPFSAMTSGTGTTTGTSGVSVISAPGANIFLYITDVIIANTGSTTSLITLQLDPAGTPTTLGYTIAPAGGGSNLHFSTPLKVTTANKAFGFTAGSASTTIYCTAIGFTAKV